MKRAKSIFLWCGEFVEQWLGWLPLLGVCSKNVRTSSKKHRQLGNEVIGSPATRARHPFFGEISSRFEFSIKFEPTFLRNARICILSPCDKRILAWLLNKMTSRIGSSQKHLLKNLRVNTKSNTI